MAEHNRWTVAGRLAGAAAPGSKLWRLANPGPDESPNDLAYRLLLLHWLPKVGNDPDVAHDYYLRWGDLGMAAYRQADDPEAIHASLEVTEKLTELLCSPAFKALMARRLGGLMKGAFPPIWADLPEVDALRLDGFRPRQAAGRGLRELQDIVPLLREAGKPGPLLRELRRLASRVGTREQEGALWFTRAVVQAADEDGRADLITKTSLLLLFASRGLTRLPLRNSDEWLPELDKWRDRIRQARKRAKGEKHRG